jgi:glycine/D-amino acid oxidase-like deaminating enzyme
VPSDGTISAQNLLNAFVEESHKNGIVFVENCEVKKVLVKTTRGGQYYKVRGAETSKGTIECDIFVNCAGIVMQFIYSILANIFFTYIKHQYT